MNLSTPSAERAPKPANPDFVVFGRSPWGPMLYPWHSVAARLARTHRVVYVRHPEPMGLGRLSAATSVLPNAVVEVLPVDLPLQRFDGVRAAGHRGAADAIRKGLGPAEGPVVALMYPRASLGTIRELRPDLVVYVVIDDYSRKQDGTDAPDDVFVAWEREAVSMADVVALGGAFLKTRFEEYGHSAMVLLEMAYDDELFDGAPRECPDALRGLPRPLIGFAGTVRASRIDLALVDEAASRRPDLSFAFVGETIEDRGASFTALRRRSNVQVLGPASYSETPAFVQHFDLVMAPYLDRHVNRGYYPLKVFDGLGMGRAAVVAPDARLTEMAPHVRGSRDADSFLEAADALLAIGNSPAREAERRAAVSHRRLTNWIARLKAEVNLRLARA